MMTFEIDSSKEGIEVYLDSNGVDELIRYLNYIKNNQDHYHLVAGNELDEERNQSDNILVKHVKLIYVD